MIRDRWKLQHLSLPHSMGIDCVAISGDEDWCSCGTFGPLTCVLWLAVIAVIAGDGGNRTSHCGSRGRGFWDP